MRIKEDLMWFCKKNFLDLPDEKEHNKIMILLERMKNVGIVSQKDIDDYNNKAMR